ncbi:MAG: stage II sporulation protein M [Nanoarchaeota archaeon]|nr:stage II sporulation protein M [Nanoarchaeota archaeon]
MFEELISIASIRRSPVLSFLLGACYSAIAIGIALWLFSDDPALIAVALVTLMFYPTLSVFLKSGEDVEARKKETNPLTFFRDHLPLYRLYVGFFLGVFLVFALFSLNLPALAANHLLKNQMSIFLGAASWSQGLFLDLLTNNLLVLLVIFLTSFFLGEGGILLITWNASVWGTIFGSLARNAGLATQQSPLGFFLMILAIILPHMLLEAFGYFTSAISGAAISKGLLKERFGRERSIRVLRNTLVALAIAVVFILVGALVETFVLQNATFYRTLIGYSLV